MNKFIKPLIAIVVVVVLGFAALLLDPTNNTNTSSSSVDSAPTQNANPFGDMK